MSLQGKSKFNIKPPKGYEERLYPFMEREEINNILNPDHADSPFYGYVGNRPAIAAFGDILYSGFLHPSFIDAGRSNHCAGPLSVAFIGPPSTGKTEFAKRGANALQLPFIECDRSIRNADALFEIMEENYTKWGISLAKDSKVGAARYFVPPAIIFFDEAQELRGDWLLKATEPKDATLITKDAVVDVRQILWIFCTTHRGKLSPAFDSRTQKVHLQPYTRQQVAEILRFRYPQFDEATRLALAGYGRSVPRECINFAEQLMLAAARDATLDYTAVCKQIAERNGVDEEGLTSQHVEVLRCLLANENVSHKRLADQIRVAEEDLENYILPPIAVQLPDRPPLVSVSSRGYTITDTGREAARKRNLG